MTTAAGRAAETILPPVVGVTTNVSGVNTTVTSANVTTAAARSALVLPSSNAKVYVTVAAMTQNIWVGFKLGTGAATITTSNGWPIPAGTEKSFWVNPNEVNDIEYVSSANTGVISFYTSSPKYEGS